MTAPLSMAGTVGTVVIFPSADLSTSRLGVTVPQSPYRDSRNTGTLPRWLQRIVRPGLFRLDAGPARNGQRWIRHSSPLILAVSEDDDTDDPQPTPRPRLPLPPLTGWWLPETPNFDPRGWIQE